MFPQSGRDLGERMHNALGTALANGHERVALVGMDIPDLTSATVLDSLGLLLQCDVVFGPTLDGGYYLVAVKRSVKEMFTGIPWSNPETLRRSIQRAKDCGLSVSLANTLNDIDTIDDVRKHKG
jgi:rSAM/selenodomain-associated transferase 1